eukprot:maker-scaffold298_size217389-snap-gene-1.14 protein:Tk12577 transcript:maker-scaffold298_size217389-snap-gene-1.14-mRNA-1 annotation:"solute carrier family 26 member 10-like isoform x3"
MTTNPNADEIFIHRPAFDLKQSHQVSGRIPKEPKSLRESLHLDRNPCHRPKSWKKIFNHYLPITDWLFNYKVKSDLVADLIAGITIAIMHIPQGMAYAQLAETDPMVGLYTAVFPVIVYTLLGPSRHVSMGTNPLTAILLGAIVKKYATPYGDDGGGDNGDGNWDGSSTTTFSVVQSQVKSTEYTDIQVVTAVCLLSGIWQLGLSILGLGRLSWILSDVLVSGYTTAAAIHVLVSQLKGVFGIHPEAVDESSFFRFKIYTSLKGLIEKIDEFNLASFIIAVVCILVLVANNEFLKPKLAQKCSFPVPIQLIVVAAGTLLSYFLKFEEKFGIDVVGELKTGFQVTVPEVSLFGKIIVDSIIVAIVGYCITLSMAKIFAQKFHYSVDGNQELFSEGVSNVVGSFFSCLPSGASMSRSSVQVAVGGRTQLTSVVSVIILVVVIMTAEELFYALPKAVLSAIILVALKNMLMQFHDFPKFYRNSKLDAVIWGVTFIAVIVLDIDTGLIIGIVVALLALVYRSFAASIEEVAPVANTGMIVEVAESEFAVRPCEAVILRVSGAISFANFEDVLDRLRRILAKTKPEERQVVILDVSSVPYMDQTGAKKVYSWLKEGTQDSQRILAAPTAKVERMLTRVEVGSDKIFPTVMDALLKAQSQIRETRSARHANQTKSKDILSTAIGQEEETHQEAQTYTGEDNPGFERPNLEAEVDASGESQHSSCSSEDEKNDSLPNNVR